MTDLEHKSLDHSVSSSVNVGFEDRYRRCDDLPLVGYANLWGRWLDPIPRAEVSPMSGRGEQFKAASRSQRFGVRNSDGARSSEWVVMWKAVGRDVYVACRTLGETIKFRFQNDRGKCHVYSPSAKWLKGRPDFVYRRGSDSRVVYPFRICFATKELRSGPWPVSREKGTIWLPAPEGHEHDGKVTVGFFVERGSADKRQWLRELGWSKTIVDSLLPNGLRVLVLAANVEIAAEERGAYSTMRLAVEAAVEKAKVRSPNPRLLFGADTKKGFTFYEVAGASEGEIHANAHWMPDAVGD